MANKEQIVFETPELFTINRALMPRAVRLTATQGIIPKQ